MQKITKQDIETKVLQMMDEDSDATRVAKDIADFVWSLLQNNHDPRKPSINLVKIEGEL